MWYPRIKSDDVRCPGNAWFIPYKTIHSKKQKGGHPAIFPQELAERCIKLSGKPEGSHVYDPFLGSGSTLFAALKLNMTASGSEIDPEIIQYIKEKLKNAY